MEIFARVATMSASSLWASGFIILVAIFGIWFVIRLILKQAKPGYRVRIKAPFFEIETGPSVPPPDAVADKVPERGPPTLDAPKSADSDPPS